MLTFDFYFSIYSFSRNSLIKLKFIYFFWENDDGKTVAALDVLVPKVGEIIGGSQREERYDLLKSKFEKHDLDLEAYKWYLDLRKYQSKGISWWCP